MLDSPKFPEHLQPTGSNIIREIHNLVSNPAEGDHHVFYYSGHGVQTICEDNSEWDGRNEGIVGMDGEYIVDDLLHNKLVVPLKKTKKTRLFVRTSAYYILKSSGFDPIYRPYLIAAILKLCWTCVVVVSQGLGQEAQGVLSQGYANPSCNFVRVTASNTWKPIQLDFFSEMFQSSK
ncbi:hypothetical protein SCLCIDRAFT_1222038 [Scleroderma citrinum Foug A]|uniref:Peptidase C14 caspase domain-containing protein n=1 Tax=Scleroderma citrinum Foug A TaxID=1036808 RepID=A0A0C3DE17_9AGAM|nr:hypothetical protein SCLCIDRAFT_1222038 [Scleroderma citrinum Foug A]